MIEREAFDNVIPLPPQPKKKKPTKAPAPSLTTDIKGKEGKEKETDKGKEKEKEVDIDAAKADIAKMPILPSLKWRKGTFTSTIQLSPSSSSSATLELITKEQGKEAGTYIILNYSNFKL